MNQEELQAAIEQPAQKLEVQLEAQLTQRILDDVGQEPGNLPLLEFALTRLWEKQENRVLTHKHTMKLAELRRRSLIMQNSFFNNLVKHSKNKQSEFLCN
jgi:hypothetical protein